MKVFCLSVCLAGGLAAPAFGCDVCAVYAARHARGEIGSGFFTGVAEQFTHFGTLQEDGHEVSNPADQFLDSSVTQLLLGYNFTERFGVQFNAPVIYRSFRRLEDGLIEKGTESGLGDVSLLANWIPYRREKMHYTFDWHILAGVKFPTGSTDRLREELEEEPEMHHDGEDHDASGIHGHDLTLGSGSFDGIVGTSLFYRWKRFYADAIFQYAIRSEGDFDYQFADDMTWAGGPGFFLALEDDYSLSLQVVVSGEHKERDTFRGERADDTGLTAVYLGPQINLTWRDHLSGQIGADLPVSIDNTALQIVPDYRVRAALTWHF